MYFKYGKYAHPANEVDVTSFSGRTMYSKRNRVVFSRHTLTLTGHIIQSTQATIKTKIQELEAAYAFDLEDAALYHDDDTLSAHLLDNSSSINGVRVRKIEYPKGGGAEYATGRYFRITLEADYLNTSVDQVYSFSETVRLIGTGGTAWELIPRFQGPPVARKLFTQTPQRIIQFGETVGVTGWTAPMSPLLPLLSEHLERRVIEHSSPIKIGVHVKLLYPLKYKYEFSLIDPLPILRPRVDWN